MINVVFVDFWLYVSLIINKIELKLNSLFQFYIFATYIGYFRYE